MWDQQEQERKLLNMVSTVSRTSSKSCLGASDEKSGPAGRTSLPGVTSRDCRVANAHIGERRRALAGGVSTGRNGRDLSATRGMKKESGEPKLATVAEIVQGVAKSVAALKQPLVYTVVRNDANYSGYVYVRKEPHPEAYAVARLPNARVIHGFPSRGWLQLRARDDQLEGCWVFIGRQLAACCLKPTLCQRFKDGLDVEWPGMLNAASASYRLDWKSEDTKHSVFTYEPRASVSRLPAVCLVWIRVVAILGVSRSSNPDNCVHVYGPWLEVEPRDERAAVSDSEPAGPKCTPGEEGAQQHEPRSGGLGDSGLSRGPPGGEAPAGAPMPAAAPAMAVEPPAATPSAADLPAAHASPDAAPGASPHAAASVPAAPQSAAALPAAPLAGLLEAMQTTAPSENAPDQQGITDKAQEQLKEIRLGYLEQEERQRSVREIVMSFEAKKMHAQDNTAVYKHWAQ